MAEKTEHTARVKCPRCAGKGKVMYSDAKKPQDCLRCAGKGTLAKVCSLLLCLLFAASAWAAPVVEPHPCHLLEKDAPDQWAFKGVVIGAHDDERYQWQFLAIRTEHGCSCIFRVHPRMITLPQKGAAIRVTGGRVGEIRGAETWLFVFELQEAL